MSDHISGDIINSLMNEIRIDRKELSEKIDINYQTLSKLITGDRPLTIQHAAALSEFFTRELGRKITIDYLIGRETAEVKKAGSQQQEEMVMVPILGTVRAGLPIFASENIIGYERMSADTVKNGEYFYLSVIGDSMIDANIFPGGRVFVRKQDWVDSGQIAIVLVNGDEATMKKVKWANDKIILYAANAKYEPQIYDVRDIKILGRVIKSEINH